MIQFGHGWDLAMFTIQEEIDAVMLRLTHVNEALWIGYKNSGKKKKKEFLQVWNGKSPMTLLPWDKTEPNGAPDSCARLVLPAD